MVWNPQHCGGMLSDTDICAAVSRGEIVLKIPKGADDTGPYEDAICDASDVKPAGSLEPASLALQMFAYFDGDDFRPIPREGLVLRPNQSIVVKTKQHLGLSNRYAALQFGLHRNQMDGIVVSSGQIQPGWGKDEPCPLYVRVWNHGRTKFTLREGKEISRLMFFPLTSEAHRRGTSEADVLHGITKGLEDQAKAASFSQRIRLVTFTLAITLVIALLLILPHWWAFLRESAAQSVLSIVLGSLLVGFAAVLGDIFPILRGVRS